MLFESFSSGMMLDNEQLLCIISSFELNEFRLGKYFTSLEVIFFFWRNWYIHYRNVLFFRCIMNRNIDRLNNNSPKIAWLLKFTLFSSSNFHQNSRSTELSLSLSITQNKNYLHTCTSKMQLSRFYISRESNTHKKNSLPQVVGLLTWAMANDNWKHSTELTHFQRTKKNSPNERKKTQKCKQIGIRAHTHTHTIKWMSYDRHETHDYSSNVCVFIWHCLLQT